MLFYRSLSHITTNKFRQKVNMYAKRLRVADHEIYDSNMSNYDADLMKPPCMVQSLIPLIIVFRYLSGFLAEVFTGVK